MTDIERVTRYLIYAYKKHRRITIPGKFIKKPAILKRVMDDTNYYGALQYFHDEAKTDENMELAYCRTRDKLQIIEYASEKWKKDSTILKRFMVDTNYYNVLQYFHDEAKTDENMELAYRRARDKLQIIEYASEKWKKDSTILKRVMVDTNYYGALQCFHDEAKTDENMELAYGKATKMDKLQIIDYASEKWKKDPAILKRVMDDTRNYYYATEYFHDEAKTDENMEFAYRRVRDKHQIIDYASEKWKKDPAILKRVMDDTNYYGALQYFHDEAKTDENMDLAYRKARYNHQVIPYASEKWKKDPAILKRVINNTNYYYLQYFHSEAKTDENMELAYRKAKKGDKYRIIPYASEKWKKDPAILKRVMDDYDNNHCDDLLQYFHDEAITLENIRCIRDKFERGGCYTFRIKWFCNPEWLRECKEELHEGSLSVIKWKSPEHFNLWFDYYVMKFESHQFDLVRICILACNSGKPEPYMIETLFRYFTYKNYSCA